MSGVITESDILQDICPQFEARLIRISIFALIFFLSANWVDNKYKKGFFSRAEPEIVEWIPEIPKLLRSLVFFILIYIIYIVMDQADKTDIFFRYTIWISIGFVILIAIKRWKSVRTNKTREIHTRDGEEPEKDNKETP